MVDIRERHTPHGVTFDHERMLIVVEVDDYYADCDEFDGKHEIPAVYEVCPTCDGKGSHVNPSIDSHGISAEEMYDDPEFAEDYFGGAYDVSCNECEGRRVVLTPKKGADERAVNALDQAYRFEAEYAAEREAEMRMGY